MTDESQPLDPYAPEHIEQVRRLAFDPRFDRHFWPLVVRRLILTIDILVDELRKR